MMNPLVSVIVTNYNYANYLDECIESVLSQSYRDLEVIIVDDGSTDHSREIIGRIDDRRVVTIFQENAGQAAAFNAGFNACHGEFVAFLDSDDFWTEDKVAKTVAAFDRADIIAVQHNLRVVDGRSRDRGRAHPGIKPGTENLLLRYFAENHTGFFSATSGIVCRKSVLREIFPLDVQWRICADVAFNRPLPIFGLVRTLEEDLGGYRIHGANRWMNSDDQKNWLENQQAYTAYTNFWLKKYGYEETIVFEQSRVYARCLDPSLAKDGLLKRFLARMRGK